MHLHPLCIPGVCAHPTGAPRRGGLRCSVPSPHLLSSAEFMLTSSVQRRWGFLPLPPPSSVPSARDLHCMAPSVPWPSVTHLSSDRLIHPGPSIHLISDKEVKAKILAVTPQKHDRIAYAVEFRVLSVQCSRSPQTDETPPAVHPSDQLLSPAALLFLFPSSFMNTVSKSSTMHVLKISHSHLLLAGGVSGVSLTPACFRLGSLWYPHFW